MRLKIPAGKPPAKRFVVIAFMKPPKDGKPVPRYCSFGEPELFPQDLVFGKSAEVLRMKEALSAWGRGIARVYEIRDDGRMVATPEPANHNVPTRVFRSSQARETAPLLCGKIDSWGDDSRWPEREFWPTLKATAWQLKKASWG